MMIRLRESLQISMALVLSFLSFMAEAEQGMTPVANQSADKNQTWQASRTRPQIALTTAFDSLGKLWLAQVDNGHILLSQSDNQGQSFSTPVVVNTEKETIAAEGENRPKIAFGSHNEIFLSWTRSLEQPYSGDVRFARSLDGGKTFSTPLTVNDNHEIISHRFETMSVDQQGRIHLAWLDKRDLSASRIKGENYTGSAVYYSVSENNGESFSVNRKLADHSCECCRVAMTIDRTDTPVVFWRHIYGDNVRDHALLKVDGASQPVRVSYDDWKIEACPHHGGAVSIDTNNRYHLTWFNNGPQRHGLFYAHSNDQGKTFSTPIAVGNYETQAAHPFVLTVNDAVILVWKEFDGKQSLIKTMQSTDAGITWQTVRTLTTTDGASDHPLLISDGQQVWLSWNTVKQGLIFMPVTSGKKS